MKVLIFDTETSGLPPRIQKGQRIKDFLEVWPYLMQLTYIIYDLDTMSVDKIYNKYIDVPQKEIEKIQYQIEDNKKKLLSNQEILKERYDVNVFKLVKKIEKTISILSENIKRWEEHKKVSIRGVNEEFFYDLEEVELLVAHNIMFDYKMMLATALRDPLNQERNIMILEKMKKQDKCFCTMEEGKKFCKCFKYPPSLTKTYEKLFGYQPDESKLHDSLFDVVITLRVFVKILTGKDIYISTDIEGNDTKTMNVIAMIKEVEPKKKGGKSEKNKKRCNKKTLSIHQKKSKKNKLKTHLDNKTLKYKKKNLKKSKKYFKKKLYGGSKCVIEGKINLFKKLTAKDLKQNFNNCYNESSAKAVESLKKIKLKAEKSGIEIISLLEAGFSLENLEFSGYTKDEIKSKIKPWELRKILSFSQIRSLGFNAKEIKESMDSIDAMNNLSKFRNNFDIKQALDCGFNLLDIESAGFAESDFKEYLQKVNCEKDYKTGLDWQKEKKCKDFQKHYCATPQYISTCRNIDSRRKIKVEKEKHDLKQARSDRKIERQRLREEKDQRRWERERRRNNGLR